MEYETDQHNYDDEPRGYDDDQGRSPRPDLRDNAASRARSASPDGRDRVDSRGPPPVINEPPEEDEEEAKNSGTNLFVTGIHPRMNEKDIAEMFGRYGEVEKCNIMRDPHTRESRGFGFVNMVSSDQADAAKEGLQGEVYEGRTLSIEKARRSRPRTPTPGKYFGPPKRGGKGDDFRGPPRGRYGDRYERGGGAGGYGRRDDPYGYRGYRSSDRYDDRRRDRRDDYPPRDRYDDRYGDDRYGRGDGRRRGGDGGYDRNGGGRPPPSASLDAPPSKDYGGGGGRPYDYRGDERYRR